MNISRSLKIYILFAVISMGVITVLSFSMLAANYFAQGLDLYARYTMEQIGREIDTNDDFPPQKILGFEVTSHWGDLPKVVRDNVAPLTKHLAFEKYVVQDGWWSNPTFALFVLRYDHANNQTVYVASIIDSVDINRFKENEEEYIPHKMRITLYAIWGIIIFSILLVLLLQRIAKPVERLEIWARGLSSDSMKDPIPDFHYCELDRLAEIVSKSFQSVQKSVEREKKFLSHASHELRTPISVVRSNTELMLKLLESSCCTVEKQRIILDRILRAGYSMTELCETLLWLNRGEYKSLPVMKVELSSLLTHIINDLQYILKDRSVKVSTQFDGGEYLLPHVLAKIVLGNLIRNAFQHTQCGTVEIVQKGRCVSISNRDQSGTDSDNTLGFGLGLELTERIMRHYKWNYSVYEFKGGRDVEIEFVFAKKSQE
jgi:signal transduction histidine kinase